MSMLRTAALVAIGALAVQSAAAATAQGHGRGAFPAPALSGPVTPAPGWRDAQAVRPGADGGLRIPPPGHRGTIPGLAPGHDDDVPAAAVAAVPVPPAMPLLAAAFAALGLLRLHLRRGRGLRRAG